MKQTEFYFFCYLAKRFLSVDESFRERLFHCSQLGYRFKKIDLLHYCPELRVYIEDLSSKKIDDESDYLKKLIDQGLQFLTPDDIDYPENLRRSFEPPWVLSIKGSLQSLQSCNLSVVGAREPLAGSIDWMESELGLLLERAPLIVASGGARGVDQKVHQLCLRYQRPTLVFLPSGLEQIYPASLKEWERPIVECGGSLISELHPRAPMRKWHFEKRNRLIASIAKKLLVIECREKSGTWLTARLALEAGCEIGALPGSAFEPKQKGNVKLISQGATLVADAYDLVMILKEKY